MAQPTLVLSWHACRQASLADHQRRWAEATGWRFCVQRIYCGFDADTLTRERRCEAIGRRWTTSRRQRAQLVSTPNAGAASSLIAGSRFLDHTLSTQKSNHGSVMGTIAAATEGRMPTFSTMREFKVRPLKTDELRR